MNLEELLMMESNRDREEIVDLRALDYVSSYDDHLMCAICHCPFIRPVRLQCDHVFCQRCLNVAMTSVGGNRDEFKCPSCRSPTRDAYMNVPRLLINMCDDIRVKCPFSGEGCSEIVPRGHIQSHVDKYCVYRLMDCPDRSCGKQTRKKDLSPDQSCMHELHTCSRCEKEVMEQDFKVPSVFRKALEEHIDSCPEAIHSCAASKYGCPVKVKRTELTAHEQQCPLITMGPYLEAQNSRLNSLELTVKHLQQRNEIYEDGLANIRTSLTDASHSMSGLSREPPANSGHQPGPSSVPEADDQPLADRSSIFSSNSATTYLLALHESLREEVGQMSHAISDLDTRASMAIMNECLRIKEDMAHTNAAVSSIRMQVQWLMNPRLHQAQRTSNVRANGSDETRTPATATAGPSNSAGPSPGALRSRRLSDSGREGTKL
ncbi:hypothetical protein ASPWEDRAFT_50669 [Aspergillus wentii DTO 134E9]|uniref:RING-type domain-containing protein n=1 Tax=Aspergillus wentii DTO 134E9 TaxID=1073089 RepID=A0A1L9RRG9_ASPWE|nr:uncharacterized protein ASPWEDRAFT_50669 [Aspergillus wentii DTO 134E9]OJJ37502.1 hypothetical protein ASPWEDRAFT_50669 [Aspergillus wentii DTO 134E9]